MEASESAFIHLVMSSLVSAAKWNVLMLWCSALKACLRWTPSSRGQAGLILYEGSRTEPRIFSSSGPAEKKALLCKWRKNLQLFYILFVSQGCVRNPAAGDPLYEAQNSDFLMRNFEHLRQLWRNRRNCAKNLRTFGACVDACAIFVQKSRQNYALYVYRART